MIWTWRVRVASSPAEPHAITYAASIYDEAARQWVYTAQIAETHYTAFTNATNGQFITARLVVRRVRKTTGEATGELFDVYRHQAIFTSSPFDLVTAEVQHRGRAGAPKFAPSEPASDSGWIPDKGKPRSRCVGRGVHQPQMVYSR